MNQTDGSQGTAELWYNDAFGAAMRTDFGPFCPFLQSQQGGYSSNLVPCSVVFLGNSYFEPDTFGQSINAYVYDESKVTCGYSSFPGWHPDYLCQSNASFGGSHTIHGLKTHMWRVEWASTFQGSTRLNYRYLYVLENTNIPIRIAEDLDTGYIDITEFYLEHVPLSIFIDPLHAHPVHTYTPSSPSPCVQFPGTVNPQTWPK